MSITKAQLIFLLEDYQEDQEIEIFTEIDGIEYELIINGSCVVFDNYGDVVLMQLVGVEKEKEGENE